MTLSLDAGQFSKNIFFFVRKTPVNKNFQQHLRIQPIKVITFNKILCLLLLSAV